MPILDSCCCFKSVKNGSFASAIYTLVFYVIIMTAGSFHFHQVLQAHSTELFAFTIIMVLLSSLMVLSSILLLIGLCGDHAQMFIPWIVTLTVTICADLLMCTYLIVNSVYCLMCVISHYQACAREKRHLKYMKPIDNCAQNNFNDLVKYKVENNLDRFTGREKLFSDTTTDRNHFGIELSTISEDNEQSSGQLSSHQMTDRCLLVDGVQRKVSSDCSTGSEFRTGSTCVQIANDEASEQDNRDDSSDFDRERLDYVNTSESVV